MKVVSFTEEIVAEHFEQKMAAIAQGNKFMRFSDAIALARMSTRVPIS